MSEKYQRGFYVEIFGGDRYGSVGWYLTREEAEKEVARRMMVGAWAGMQPRVVAVHDGVQPILGKAREIMRDHELPLERDMAAWKFAHDSEDDPKDIREVYVALRRLVN